MINTLPPTVSSTPLRIIPRLDIKAPNLVKGMKLEGLRVIGDPTEYAQRYVDQGADELLYQDIVASLYNRNSLADLVQRTAERIFVPLTVGGGIRSVLDIQNLLRAGADKICINTAAIARPAFITEAASTFGSQCIVVALETIRQRDGTWKCFTDNGRQPTGLDAYDWAQRAVELGAGELLFTSVDREGMKKGFELDVAERIAKQVGVPVIVHGGAGKPDDLVAAARAGVNWCGGGKYITLWHAYGART
jgi:imidazole glycerol-phosphate synthase subunit HisF